MTFTIEGKFTLDEMLIIGYDPYQYALMHRHWANNCIDNIITGVLQHHHSWIVRNGITCLFENTLMEVK